MAFKDVWNRVRTTPKYTPSIYVSNDFKPVVSEKFKGEIVKHEIKFPTEIGEVHPFDYKVTEGLYKKFGMVTGVIDKYIDFVVGPGFFVKSEDERAQQIIEDFMRDTNFDTLLRAWLKEALLKGSGYLELGGKKDEAPQGMKILDAKHMYIKRSDIGEIEEYNQFIGRMENFDKDKVTPFKPFQIAHLALSKVGDGAYGLGIIYPGIINVNRLIGNEKEMQTLLKRKANAPIHAKIGRPDGTMQPTPEAVSAFGEKLEWLNNKHEWATDAMVEMKVLDFGAIGEKFDFVLNHDLDMLFFAFQVPEVLMGRSVNLATAPVQMDAFERRIQSIQAETEKIIENNIFTRVLQANGIDERVEFEWGQPSRTEKKERLKQLTELLKLPTLSPTAIDMIESETIKLLDLDEEALETDEAQRRKEEARAQPLVPGQNREQEQQAHSHPELTEKTYEGELIQ